MRYSEGDKGNSAGGSQCCQSHGEWNISCGTLERLPQVPADTIADVFGGTAAWVYVAVVSAKRLSKTGPRNGSATRFTSCKLLN